MNNKVIRYRNITFWKHLTSFLQRLSLESNPWLLTTRQRSGGSVTHYSLVVKARTVIGTSSNTFLQIIQEVRAAVLSTELLMSHPWTLCPPQKIVETSHWWNAMANIKMELAILLVLYEHFKRETIWLTLNIIKTNPKIIIFWGIKFTRIIRGNTSDPPVCSCLRSLS